MTPLPLPQVWGGRREEQAPHHRGAAGVPAGTEEELQQAEGQPQAHDRAEDPRALQAHLQN